MNAREAEDAVPTGRPTFYVRVVKRGFDAVAAAVLLLLLLPVILAVWAAVVAFLGTPAFYFDTRAGRHGRPIVVGKFRSMRDARDGDGRPLPDAERLGAFGRLLRRTSLDELPQLASVLTGDMSLVGPRPLPSRYAARYNRRQATRLDVLPGLTGLAQIRGRNGLGWPERLELDARYVEMMGRWYAPLVDSAILAATFAVVAWQAFSGRGIAGSGTATMEEFDP